MKRFQLWWQGLFSRTQHQRRAQAGHSEKWPAEALETRLVLTPTFDAGTVYPLSNLNGGGHPQYLAAGDFNHDGRQDIVTANTSDISVSVLLADGPGCFDTAHNFPTGRGPISVAVGDFNEDSHLDIVTADHYANTLSVLFGNGLGGFAVPVPFSVGAEPRTVIVNDFNQDGHSDLAVTNSGAQTVSVLLGNGAGGFTSAGPFGVGGFPMGLTAGDFNGDSNPDLAATIGNRVSILLGDGLGSFGPFMAFGVIGNDFAQAQSITTADFNGDNKLDLAVTNGVALFAVSVALGNGNGTFGAVNHYNAGTVQYGIVAADFDRDGAIDLAVGTPNSLHVRVLPGTGTGSFTAPVNLSSEGAYGVVTADFNLDGFPDLAAGNINNNSVRVFLNLSPYSGTTTDYGDAPDTGSGTGTGNYQTTAADGGASHLITGPMLGLYLDPDADGQPSANADGDDAAPGVTPSDEDGITLPASITASTETATTASLTVSLQCPSPTTNKLDGWIDFNRDGDWTGAGEQIFTSYELGTSSGIQTLNFTVPQDHGANVEAGISYARFRLSTAGGLAPTGAAADGEVEDYKVNIVVVSPPSRVISGAASTNEGATYTLGLSASGQGADSIHHWTINWGDGNTETVNGNPSSVPHIYDDGPNNFTITATATDSGGTLNANALTVTVNNVAPSVANNGKVSTNEGATATNAGTWSDPGVDVVTLTASIGSVTKNADGTWSWSFNTNDGPDQTQFVAITATDSDGANSTTTFNLTVNNVAPSVANAGNVTANEGATATNSGTWSDPGLDVVTLTASVGSVTKNADGTWSWSLNTSDGPDQTQDVTITATDSDGASSSTMFHLLVSNRAPTLAISGASSVNEGATYSLGLSSNDPGADTITHWIINWGDNVTQVVSGNPSSVTHVYAVGGTTYTISATATDEDGTFNANYLAVTVNRINSPPPASVGSGCHGPALIITGTDLGEIIRVVPQGRTDVKVLINGQGHGTFSLASFDEIIIHGNGGDDDIEIVAALTQKAFLFGEAGNDRVKGGNGPNVLVGGDNDDDLIGSQGNDVIIGGRGADRLVGNSGDDVLVAGFTDHDTDLIALCAILDEWSRTDLAFTQRFNHLSAGGGLNGRYRLNDLTSHDDGVMDRLTGSSDRDAFFANLDMGMLDKITDQKSNEFSRDID